MDKFVLDVGKMKDVPPLFRAVRNDKRYFASEILIEALKTEIPALYANGSGGGKILDEIPELTVVKKYVER